MYTSLILSISQGVFEHKSADYLQDILICAARVSLIWLNLQCCVLQVKGPRNHN